VNGAWSASVLGTPVTWTDGSTHYVGYDAFGTIQGGVNALAPGGTVAVAAGTFSERVTIAKALNLAGMGTLPTILQAPGGVTTGAEIQVRRRVGRQGLEHRADRRREHDGNR